MTPISGAAKEQGETYPPSVGYRERRLWVSLTAVALVDTLYFATVFYAWQTGQMLSGNGLLVVLGAIVGLLILIELLFMWSSRSQREPMDERDQSIAAGSARLAYLVFAAAVVLALILHLLNAGSGDASLFGLAMFDVPLLEVHMILAGLVTAELVRYGSALLRYRRGY